MKLRVEVTAEDIKAGAPDTCDACPIALAINRLLPIGHADVFGRPGRIVERWESGLLKRRLAGFTLPEVAVAFVAEFDRGETVDPFVFELNVDADLNEIAKAVRP